MMAQRGVSSSKEAPCVPVLHHLSCRWRPSPSHQAERGVSPFHQKVARIQVLVSLVNLSLLWGSHPPLTVVCHRVAVSTGVSPLRRHSATKGIVIAMVCTFFEVFNVPVFWPILVMYFIMLFCITMKRQIKVNADRRLGGLQIRSSAAF